MNTIKISDGYNKDPIECDCEPIFIDGDRYKLQIKNSCFVIWVTREQWENAMEEAYIEETSNSLANEVIEGYIRMEREAKYQEWLKENN